MIEAVRRALAEFLAVPLAIVSGFLGLAAVGIATDDARLFEGLRDWLIDVVFTSPEATASLLGHLAGALITLTSITLSLLLIAVQQAAGTLTHAVIDQFLRRRLNQIVFGLFVGASVYTLVVLATVAPDFNPLLSATLALVFAL